MNYLQMPDHVFKHDLTSTELRIYCDVWTMTRKGGENWKSNATIAEQFAVHRSSVIRAINGLVSRGLLEREETENGRYLVAQVVAYTRPVATTRPVASAQQGSSVPATGGVASAQQSSSVHATQIENNRELNREVSRESASLVFPFDSEKFKESWNEWREYKRDQFKFKFKTVKSEQLALHKLHRDTHGDEQQAIEAIATAIASGWRGLFPRAAGSGQQSKSTTSWKYEIAEELAARNGFDRK